VGDGHQEGSLEASSEEKGSPVVTQERAREEVDACSSTLEVQKRRTLWG